MLRGLLWSGYPVDTLSKVKPGFDISANGKIAVDGKMDEPVIAAEHIDVVNS